MVNASTVYNFEISLADVSRSVYEDLKFRVAQHPSESLDYLLTRVLAYCLEYCEGIELTDGLSDPELPAVWVRDLTGKVTAWIEVGNPSAEKIHKASKSVERVAVYTYRNPTIVLEQLKDKRIHMAHKIILHAFEPSFLEELASVIDRRNNVEVSVNEGHIYVNLGEKTFCSAVHSRPLR